MNKYQYRFCIGLMTLGALVLGPSCSLMTQVSPVPVSNVSPELSETIGRVESEVVRTNIMGGVSWNVFTGDSATKRIALYKEEQSKLEEELDEIAYADVKDNPLLHARTLQELSKFIIAKATKANKNYEFVITSSLKDEFLQYDPIKEAATAKAAADKATAEKAAAAKTAAAKAEAEKVAQAKAEQAKIAAEEKAQTQAINQAVAQAVAIAQILNPTAASAVPESPQGSELQAVELKAESAQEQTKALAAAPAAGNREQAPKGDAKAAPAAKNANAPAAKDAKEPEKTAASKQTAQTDLIAYGKTLDERGKAGLDVYLKHLIILIPILSEADSAKMLKLYSEDLASCRKAVIINSTDDVVAQYNVAQTIVSDLGLSSTFLPETLEKRKHKVDVEKIIETLETQKKYFTAS